MPVNRQLPPLHFLVIAAAASLILIWPAWKAALNGLSDLNARPAIDYLEAKSFVEFKVSAAEWHAIEDTVVKADRLMPGNPQYLEALALLHQLELSQLNNELSNEEINRHAQAAEAYFNQAIENRPTWPYYWGNLALEHFLRENFAADEFSFALANAARFGPWQNDTQRLVIDLGSQTWDFLTPAARLELILAVERGLHRQHENTIQLVSNSAAWRQICAASDASPDLPLPHVRALCAEASDDE